MPRLVAIACPKLDLKVFASRLMIELALSEVLITEPQLPVNKFEVILISAFELIKIADSKPRLSSKVLLDISKIPESSERETALL